MKSKIELTLIGYPSLFEKSCRALEIAIECVKEHEANKTFSSCYVSSVPYLEKILLLFEDVLNCSIRFLVLFLQKTILYLWLVRITTSPSMTRKTLIVSCLFLLLLLPKKELNQWTLMKC